MAKSLLYRLFGLGKLREALMSQLKNEGIVLLDEAVKGSVTYRDFHRPGKRTAWERRWFTASIALTKARLLVIWGANPIINVPLTDERIKAMQYSVEKSGAVLCVGFDAALFHDDWSGTVEYRFRTQQAPQLLEALRKQTV